MSRETQRRVIRALEHARSFTAAARAAWVRSAEMRLRREEQSEARRRESATEADAALCALLFHAQMQSDLERHVAACRSQVRVMGERGALRGAGRS